MLLVVIPAFAKLCEKDFNNHFVLADRSAFFIPIPIVKTDGSKTMDEILKTLTQSRIRDKVVNLMLIALIGVFQIFAFNEENLLPDKDYWYSNILNYINSNLLDIILISEKFKVGLSE